MTTTRKFFTVPPPPPPTQKAPEFPESPRAACLPEAVADAAGLQVLWSSFWFKHSLSTGQWGSVGASPPSFTSTRCAHSTPCAPIRLRWVTAVPYAQFLFSWGWPGKRPPSTSRSRPSAPRKRPPDRRRDPNPRAPPQNPTPPHPPRAGRVFPRLAPRPEPRVHSFHSCLCLPGLCESPVRRRRTESGTVAGAARGRQRLSRVIRQQRFSFLLKCNN